MRILTVRQPYAWQIVHGDKNIENRTRNIAGKYRGPVAIHASLKPDMEALRGLPMRHPRGIPGSTTTVRSSVSSTSRVCIMTGIANVTARTGRNRVTSICAYEIREYSNPRSSTRAHWDFGPSLTTALFGGSI
ncbi:hypothetical protein GCM10020255_022450 [Rhodococcus baikonurensis]